MAAVHNKVIIRRCDVDVPVAYDHLLLDADEGEVGGATEHGGQHAGTVGRRMNHHEDRRRNGLGEVAQERANRADATGGRTNHDHLMYRHGECIDTTTKLWATAKFFEVRFRGE